MNTERDPDLDITDLDDAARLFAAERSRLFGIVYRMLGSAMEAEDIVQEVWLRWQRYDRESVLNPAAFLTTTTTRLAINAAQSARSRVRRTLGRGCRSRSTRVRTLPWGPSGPRRWNSPCWCCWRN